MSKRHRPGKVWGVPLVLAVLMLIGLISALIGESLPYKALAWLALSVPVAVSLWYACLRRRHRVH